MPDTIAVFPEVPGFLKTCVSYYHYLARAQIDLVYPSYKKNSDGEIIVTYGEVFCRVHDCKNGRSPLVSTSNLRSHLLFEQLMKNCENKKDGDAHEYKHTKEYKGNGKEEEEERDEEEDEEDIKTEQEDEDEEEEEAYECY
ncbi:hypothetical protein N7540_004488 [Penicillium herquei]|nr:hypothetical protein N7540_004488 [Penicillium herquei]